VLQDFEEHVEQPLEDDDAETAFSPPWIPNVENSFETSPEPQAAQPTSASRPMRTSRSKRAPQARQRNS
jgi:hypothetical protein